MENTKTQQPTKQFTSGDLLIALYWIWDAFERSNMPFVLVGDTAVKAKEGSDLKGDGIDIGVRLMEWSSGAKRILDSFIGEPESDSGGLVVYNHLNIPIRIHILDDSDAVMAPDTIIYRNEYFKIPNPIGDYGQLHG